MTGSKARTERCVCGGLIVANADAPGPAVLAHGRSPRHEAWRLGLDVVEGVSGVPTIDGKPTWALVGARGRSQGKGRRMMRGTRGVGSRPSEVRP